MEVTGEVVRKAFATQGGGAEPGVRGGAHGASERGQSGAGGVLLEGGQWPGVQGWGAKPGTHVVWASERMLLREVVGNGSRAGLSGLCAHRVLLKCASWPHPQGLQFTRSPAEPRSSYF